MTMRTPDEATALVSRTLAELVSTGVLTGYTTRAVAHYAIKCHVFAEKHHSIFTHVVQGGTDVIEAAAIRRVVHKLFEDIEYVVGS